MKTTAAVLRKLQDYYDTLESRPSYKEVAQAAHMPIATAARYLNGTNQNGDLERIRAICIVLDRHDLLEELPGTQNINSFPEAITLYNEMRKENRESNLEELDHVRELHAKAEQRWAETLESKDRHINALSKRVERLEADKERQMIVNQGLLSDKDILQTEMEYFRKSKRKYERLLILTLIGFILYICIFDLPNPSNGITHLLSKLFGQGG